MVFGKYKIDPQLNIVLPLGCNPKGGAVGTIIFKHRRGIKNGSSLLRKILPVFCGRVLRVCLPSRKFTGNTGTIKQDFADSLQSDKKP